MDIKKILQKFLQNQKKNIIYWAGLIAVIDIFLITKNILEFSQIHQCRNYMFFGSLLHNCSAFEFVKYGWGWISFTNILLFLPAAAFMVLVTATLDQVLPKQE